MPDDRQDVYREIEEAGRQAKSADDLMHAIVTQLSRRMLKYNWVGFYLLEQDAKSGEPVLVLGQFAGAMTPHTRIPLNKGICGAAASTGKTVVVDDVYSDPRYLSCAIETQSEIVVPVFNGGKVVGELDIDSHFSAAFKPEDRELVERCAALLGRYLETHP